MATVSGWGKVKFYRQRTAIDLMYVRVPLISNEKCIKPHTRYNSSDITSNMLCAGGRVFDGGPRGDACSGKEFCTVETQFKKARFKKDSRLNLKDC